MIRHLPETIGTVVLLAAVGPVVALLIAAGIVTWCYIAGAIDDYRRKRDR